MLPLLKMISSWFLALIILWVDCHNSFFSPKLNFIQQIPTVLSYYIEFCLPGSSVNTSVACLTSLIDKYDLWIVHITFNDWSQYSLSSQFFIFKKIQVNELTQHSKPLLCSCWTMLRTRVSCFQVLDIHTFAN